jgi:hypothetical protein
MNVSEVLFERVRVIFDRNHRTKKQRLSTWPRKLPRDFIVTHHAKKRLRRGPQKFAALTRRKLVAESKNSDVVHSTTNDFEGGDLLL